MHIFQKAPCEHCQQWTQHYRDAPNHVMHILLTLLTCGIWAPVWLIAAMGGVRHWRCCRCGR